MPLRWNPMLESWLASFRGAAVDRQQTLVFRPTVWVESDPAPFSNHPLSNLIANALRYTAPGGRILSRYASVGEGADRSARQWLRHRQRAITTPSSASSARSETGRRHAAGDSASVSIVAAWRGLPGIAGGRALGNRRSSTFSLLIKRALPTASRPRLPEPAQSGVIIHFVGDSSDLRACMGMARNWHHELSHDPTGGGPVPETTDRGSSSRWPASRRGYGRRIRQAPRRP